jgi:hypothetical protein
MIVERGGRELEGEDDESRKTTSERVFTLESIVVSSDADAGADAEAHKITDLALCLID